MNVPDWLSAFAGLFACPLLISWLLTAALIRWAPRLGLVDHPSERKVHVHPTPRGGGLAIFVAFTLTILVCSFSLFPLSFFILQLLLSAMIVLLGLCDDLRPLPWQLRLAVQLFLSVVAVFFCLPPASLLFRILAIFWIAGHINAFNMLDNMDALSGGIAWIAAGFLAAAWWLGPQPNLADWGLPVILMGALSGFLWFNRPPARIFMGDAGSTFLGFTLGLGSAQVALREGGPSWSWAVPLCILAVPCYDLLSVVLLRLSQGRSPFHADKQHLSHRLVRRGLSSRTAVAVIYVLALASGASGLILYAVANGQTATLVCCQLAAWWIALAVMEFARKEFPHDPQTQTGTGRDSGSAAGP
jgi:UDP-GlcNAc:undecaprenyl-phosphate GlcNAc-1-phosphate transferase